jgi:hypothetical protein
MAIGNLAVAEIIILVIFLGRIELCGFGNLCGHLQAFGP